MPHTVTVMTQQKTNNNGPFDCRVCGGSFATGKDFSDHFLRDKNSDGTDSISIIGCKSTGPIELPKAV